MTFSKNYVSLIGNVGGDVKCKETTNSKLATFSLVTEDTYQKDGKWERKPEWHQIIMWGKLAEQAEQYLRKGSKVNIEGKIQYREYEKDGEKKHITEIVGLNFIPLDKNQKKETSNDDLPF